MTQKELEDYLWGAANILRGMIDAADFKQYIFPLLFFKRVSDLWDEEYQLALAESDGDLTYAQFAENHRFQIPEGCHWEDVRKKTIDVGLALQQAMHGIEKANFELLHDVFGDAQWTNKRRISDEKMLDLIEHFSQINLGVSNVPHDIMGEGYEYLIKKFADDSGHTAAEFYTNRTVVKLMTQITDPQSTESIYDPTCGSGGILLSAALHLKEQGKEYRSLKLYGQELNLITSAIARINMFMHNVDEFLIVQGDTLESPQILENDELKKFDVIMANPPYSVKKWSQKKWMNDPFGRNIWGTPPQGCADYAFQQHIMKSLNPETGRCVVLWPHGVLFRDAESAIRKKMIEEDYVDAVIGLGKNLFYNSSMESCLLVCRMKKPEERKGKIIFIDAKDEIRIERSSAWLKEEHINRISETYHRFSNIDRFSKVVSNADVLKENGGNLTVHLYVKPMLENDQTDIEHLLSLIQNLQNNLHSQMNSLINELQRYNGQIADGNSNVVMFGTISESIEEHAKDKRDITRVVGLENIEPGEFTIKSWGNIDEGTTFTKRFQKGDVLFGKRRAYLKKVAIASFDGVCSSDILVLRAKPDKILPELLPFYVSAEPFIEYAVRTSAGSLSPRTRWKDLAKFEVSLPDLTTQSKIVEVLSTIESTKDQLSEQKKNLKKLKHQLLNEILG